MLAKTQNMKRLTWIKKKCGKEMTYSTMVCSLGLASFCPAEWLWFVVTTSRSQATILGCWNCDFLPMATRVQVSVGGGLLSSVYLGCLQDAPGSWFGERWQSGFLQYQNVQHSLYLHPGMVLADSDADIGRMNPRMLALVPWKELSIHFAPF